ncbi:GNAT family N-acetyltransferase [Asanoa sp. WMMD1127]|uniref:GNAT family N-acetyltransferase n=1 Tax=Asanoa sp. WMMD1127 TaxID=3016107 RepID=UPI0024173DF8|nr:GNAT family N-acetyltransferase [Asanoa sp. WMMD1127]MDG4825620.1 GNAT family N-acetyltransferase [Asanoa sp. WMMD1127]
MIRQSRPADVERLEQTMPTGPSRFHEARYGRQADGLSTFLVAEIDGVLVGCGEVLWAGAKEPAVRERIPDCPEINGLAVAPGRQSQGIGTALVRAAEALAAERGHHRVGLGVDDHNPRAAALYARLGYTDPNCRYVDHYSYVDEAGTRHEVADPCRFLVKDLGR